jgi:hypothetical protein
MPALNRSSRILIADYLSVDLCFMRHGSDAAFVIDEKSTRAIRDKLYPVLAHTLTLLHSAQA